MDALFIVAFRWGIVGAAVATGIGQVLGGVIPLVYFARKNSSLLRIVKTGALNQAELKNIFKKSMVILSISGVALSGLAQALAVLLAKLFVGYDAALYRLTVDAFRMFSFAFIFSGIAVYSSGFFTALNNGLVSALLSFLRALVFQIAYVLLLPFLFGVNGIRWSVFATEASAFVVAVAFFIGMKNKYHYA